MNIRIIPRLDIKGSNLIKGIHLDGLRVIGDPNEFAVRAEQDKKYCIILGGGAARLNRDLVNFQKFKFYGIVIRIINQKECPYRRHMSKLSYGQGRDSSDLELPRNHVSFAPLENYRH